MRISPTNNESAPTPFITLNRSFASRWTFAQLCGVLLISTLLGARLSSTSAYAQSDAPSETQPDKAPTIQEIRSARDEGRIESAVEMLLELDGKSDQDLSVDFVLMVRAGAGHLQPEQTDQLFLGAVRSLDRSPPTTESMGQRLLFRNAAAMHFSERGKGQQAATIIRDAFDELEGELNVPADRGRSLVKLAMRAAWAELNANRFENAETLYLRLVDFSARDGWREIVGPDRSLAMLGLGWATAMRPGQQTLAADRLQQFVDSYPSHHDAPRAAVMRIRSLQQTDHQQSAATAITDFLDRWPASPFAQQIVLDTLSGEIPDDATTLRRSVEHWILSEGTTDQWSIELVGHALSFAAPQLPPPRFDALVQRLAGEDKTGQRFAVLLNDWTNANEGAVAEQIAATLISGDLENCSKMARESACRWAGRTGRWSMLAMAAESADLSDPAEHRTAHVDRLFAESLMQSGRGAEASLWWAHLVDRRDATDFATLLRCAECAVAHDTVTTAQQRLERVGRALSENDQTDQGVQSALVDLLKADLAVRKVDFSRARSLFEQVVRSPSTTPTLRGRAQWMIGETFFLQHQFSDAIGAYRLVEGLDPGGPYVAAALVQAGKSFEQLGRTREAGVCYGTLLGRFADSSYASEARRRMAALPNTENRNSGKGRAPNSGAASSESSRLRR